ncbi:Condensin complex subunit 3 [Sugiyamaella lignohabitans]|uniref:Condensin complex subunit 3 n=1 Tax=Sugiyamaella lignohabitans TaxID=796027 RepID=A0A161HMP2_9ASCO|nr:Condensin complex subunit 3 [Sugiyamaella lignohabitans]ANB15107.1 Condensin complex subunit 3 [Sugiyamaella lignohabitans]
MGRVIVDSLRRLVRAYDEGEVTVTPTQIMQQLVDWTDPAKVVGGQGVSSLVHVELAKEILERITQTDSKDERKALCLSLSRLNITKTAEDSTTGLGDIRDLVADVLENDLIGEALSKNALIRFQTVVDGLTGDSTTVNDTASTEVSDLNPPTETITDTTAGPNPTDGDDASESSESEQE